jgi:hypothetical protein
VILFDLFKVYHYHHMGWVILIYIYYPISMKECFNHEIFIDDYVKIKCPQDSQNPWFGTLNYALLNFQIRLYLVLILMG